MVCDVVCTYLLVDISNVDSSCYRSPISGLLNAAFNLLIFLFIHRCCFQLTLAAAATVYGNGESNKFLSKILIGDILILSFNSISTCSGAVAVVWSALPVDTSIRCFEAGDRLCGVSPYCISSFESCFAVLIDPVLISQYLMLCIVF
jgi:hypothetical protein